MKIEATNEMPGGLEAEIARLRTQANAWEQVWASLMKHGPDGWRDFSKVGVESAVEAIRALAASTEAKGIDVDQFVRECCEAHRAFRDSPGTICIDVQELSTIAEQHLAASRVPHEH